MHDSLKKKAGLLPLVDSPSQVLREVNLQELKALRQIEIMLRTRVRGYGGAAKLLANILHAWISCAENRFNEDTIGSRSTSNGLDTRMKGLDHQASIAQSSAAVTAATEGDCMTGILLNGWIGQPHQWHPPNTQPLFSTAQRVPTTAYATPSLETAYCMPNQMDLSLVTAMDNFQGTYNWQPPQDWLPEPPSAALGGTDFSGANMFNLDTENQDIDVGDLLLPSWMAPVAHGALQQ